MRIQIIPTLESYSNAMSYTRYRQWQECPASVAYRVLQGWESKPTPEQVVGATLHKQAEVDPLFSYPEHIRGMISRHPSGYSTELSIALDEYGQSVGFNSPKAAIRGKIDLLFEDLTGHLSLYDLKPFLEVDPMQMQLYIAMTKQIFDKKTVLPSNTEVRGYYITYSGEEKEIRHDDTALNLLYKAYYEWMDCQKDWMYEIKMQGCDRCGATHICPAFQEQFQAMIPLSNLTIPDLLAKGLQTTQEASYLALFLQLVSPLLDKGKDMLRDYVKVNGGVDIPDTNKQYAITTSLRAKPVDMNALLSRISEMVDFEDLLLASGISAKAFQDFAGKHSYKQELLEIWDELTEKEPIETLRVINKKKGE